MCTAMYKFVTFSYRSSIILVLFSSKLSPFLFDCQNTIKTDIYSPFRTNCMIMIQIYIIIKHAHSHRHQNKRVGGAEREHSPFTTHQSQRSGAVIMTNYTPTTTFLQRSFCFYFSKGVTFCADSCSCTKVLWMTLQVQLVHLQLYKSSGETIYYFSIN